MNLQATTTQATRQTREIAAIQRIVAEEHGQPLEIMTAKERHEPIATIRQIAMFLARELTGASYPDIAEAFKRRDHGTAMWAVKAIRFKCEIDLRRRLLVDKIKTRCERELAAA